MPRMCSRTRLCSLARMCSRMCSLTRYDQASPRLAEIERGQGSRGLHSVVDLYLSSDAELTSIQHEVRAWGLDCGGEGERKTETEAERETETGPGWKITRTTPPCSSPSLLPLARVRFAPPCTVDFFWSRSQLRMLRLERVLGREQVQGRHSVPGALMVDYTH